MLQVHQLHSFTLFVDIDVAVTWKVSAGGWKDVLQRHACVLHIPNFVAIVLTQQLRDTISQSPKPRANILLCKAQIWKWALILNSTVLDRGGGC